jgi:hypothetical protein
MDEVFSSRPDLTDQTISHPDVEYVTDGSSFVLDGTCFARYAVVTLDTVIEVHLLLTRTSAQKVELIALTWALQFTAVVWVNIYMTLNMPPLPFMSMEPYMKKGGSLTQEEKV